MFNNKQIYWLGSLAIILAFVFVQQQVFAQWTPPVQGPGTSGNLNVVTNPLDEDLNFSGFNLTNGGTASFGAVSGTSGTFSGALSSASATVGGNLQVTTINGQTPVFGGGGVKNPLEANLSGADRYGLSNLKGCDPARSASCAAISATAGKSSFVDSYAYGVFGQTDVGSGTNPSYGVYGLASNSGGVGVIGYSTPANATGVYGVARNASGVAGMFYNQASGKALVANGLTELNGATTINSTLGVTGTSSLQNTNVTGILRVNAEAPEFGRVSAIVGVADGENYDNNAGVEGIGTVGVYGNGHLVGVYGDSMGYGGIFKGGTATGWNPPGGGVGPGELPEDNEIITKLFGIEKTLAGLTDAGPLGLVAVGGYQYSGGFSKAGLGLCAISGELAHDSVSDDDFFAYCKDGIGANNYAGFFAGNVYLKNGSLQINDSLAVANENLIYANASSAAANSHLLKLQTAGADKFLVDKDGKVTVDTDTFFVDAGNNRVGIGTITPNTKLTVALPFGNVLGDGVKVTRGTGRLLMGQGTSDASNFVPIVSGKSVGDAPFMIRGIQSDAQSTAEAFRFSAARADENGLIENSDLAMTFYNWTSHLMSIKGDGTVGIGVLNPNSSYKLDVAGSINSTGGYRANGAAGLNSTINVRNAAGTGSCTMTIRGGLVTATTCP